MNIYRGIKFSRYCYGGKQARNLILLAIFFMMARPVPADDTELYVYESSSRTGDRPQILIIFDNSRSMEEYVYDVDESYSGVEGSGSQNTESGFLYFTKGTPDSVNIPVLDEQKGSRRFKRENNGCQTSWEYLNKYGTYTGFIREYSFSGQNGTWKELPENAGANLTLIDCFEDIQDERYGNASGIVDGLPLDGTGNRKEVVGYTEVNDGSSAEQKKAAKEAAERTGFGTGRPVTFYTEDYLRWYHSDKKKVTKTRLQVAKDAIQNVIVTTPGVDLGLAIFNLNFKLEGERDGGRIISGIKSMTAASKIELINRINDISYAQATPLCETFYEAFRYFSGKGVHFADKDSDYFFTNSDGKVVDQYLVKDTPQRDMGIIKGGSYVSPFKPCQSQVYVVYITDGEPTQDASADDLIQEMTGDEDAYITQRSRSYLSALSSWMSRNDLNSNLAGKQTVTTFTIGFSEGAAKAEALMRKTAEKGGGRYFDAQDASKLQSAIQSVVNQILEKNASFTSPSVASNNFNKLQTLDSVYYSMFLPNKGPRWRGNIKKFQVTDKGKVVDSKGEPAIAENGNISAKSCSFWSSSGACSQGGDGDDVTKGGVAEALYNQKQRTLYGNFAAGGDLSPLTLDAASGYAGGEAKLAQHMGVDSSQLQGLFDWARGEDVDDDNRNGNRSDKRRDLLGDPLHSKPLAIDFGSSATDPDIRILVGSNHGMLHMFQDKGASVSESWAFMPWEFLPNLAELKANAPSGVHSVYGFDGSPVAFTKRVGNRLEKAWVFMGLRRGGRGYYALDVTNPDNPKLMWHVNADTAGMSELGQSWAKPVVTSIPGYGDKPVLIFGAGYSPAKDTLRVGSADSQGRGVFILDAETGKLLHRFGPGGDTEMPELRDSIPNTVAVLDDNSDGVSDRIYATDTGANIWRLDLPDADRNNWSAFKFASLGGSTESTDRRFFAAPVVAQTMLSNQTENRVTTNGESKTVNSSMEIPYDAVVVGSGLRPSPSDTSRSDMFFVLQDRNTASQNFNEIDPPQPLTLAELYDVTAKAPNSDQEHIDFGRKLGWYYDFTRSGEKSLSDASIIKGRVFFTSYVPGSKASAEQCLVSGKGYLYGFDLHKGARSYTQTYLETGESLPDTPQLVVQPGTNADGTAGDSYLYLIGIGNAAALMDKLVDDMGCPAGDDQCVGEGPATHKLYYFQAD
ncbi:pilus assembly protein [Shewanella algae]|uniref:pilus assembly protein n=1 Tax=Shewanella algae TaxID=38313 RepID=UPI00313ABA0A